MNRKKFWRLFLVLLFPMLIAGWITAEKVTKNVDVGEVLCKAIKDGELFDCSWGRMNEDNLERKRYVEASKFMGDFWIKLKDEENIGLIMDRFVNASSTSLGLYDSVKVKNLSSYAKEKISSLTNNARLPAAGEDVLVFFGFNNYKSEFKDGLFVFSCVSAEINGEDGSFTANCIFDGGAEKIDFLAENSAREKVMNLVESIVETGRESRNNYLYFYFSMLFIYVLFFFLFSLLSLFIFKAYKFVNK